VIVLRWLAGHAFGVVAWLWLRVGDWLERHIFADDPDPGARSLLDRRDGRGDRG
jgi:hypothetical protein